MIGEGVVTAVRVITPLSEYAVTIRNAEFLRSPDGSWRTDSDNGKLVLVSDMLDALVMWYGRAQGLQRILDETLSRVEDLSAECERLKAERADLQTQLDTKSQAVRTLEDSRDWWMRECGKRGGPQVEPTRGMPTIADITLNASRPLDEARVTNVANAVRMAMEPERGRARFSSDHGDIIVKKAEVAGIAPADRFRTFLFLRGNSVKVEATTKDVAIALGWEAKAEAQAAEAPAPAEGGAS